MNAQLESVFFGDPIIDGKIFLMLLKFRPGNARAFILIDNLLTELLWRRRRTEKQQNASRESAEIAERSPHGVSLGTRAIMLINDGSTEE